MTHAPFVLVDGSSYLHRAFHALPPLANAKGQPTGAIYGVINMLRQLINTYHPRYIAVVFDAKGKNFRHALYPDYKAHRPPMDEALRSQIQPLHDIIEAMGLPLLCIQGVEADDVIATLAHKATDEQIDTIISTGDKDMAQLVNGHVRLVNTMTNTTLDSKGVEEKFGVPPKRIVDYLALIGDQSDNVPGVPGVGPKTAVKWLNTYGSLEGIIEQADAIKGKVGEALRDHLDQLELAKTLVTVKRDLILGQDPKDLERKPIDIEKLTELFKELEFKRWLLELSKETANSQPPAKTKEGCYETVLDETLFAAWLEKLRTAKLVSVDTETTSLDTMQAQIVGLSFSIKPGEAIYIPVAHTYPDAPKQLSREFVLNALKPLLEDPNLKKVGQNLKYDRAVFANHGITLRGIEFDTMLESYIFNSTGSRHDLDTLALKYLQHNTIHYEDIAGSGAKQIPFSEVPLEEASKYAAEDADIALQLHDYFWPQIKEDKNLKHVLMQIEMPLVPVLSEMERCGVLIDADLLKAQSTEIAHRLLELEQQAFQLAGVVFNLDSPKQLQEILYTKLGIPIIKKTPKGQPSTAEPVLQELALDFPLPKIILEYRSLSKLKSTYTDRLPEQINPKTGRVHTSYHQAIASTGRLSSSNPNLQNIPIRTEMGRRIRKAFIAPSGYQLLALDYSQIELRIMAHLSQDKRLLSAFEQGLDIHSATASEVFATPLESVTKDMRRKAKAINFGLIYGMSAFGLAKQLGIERATAQAYIDAYFARYEGVKTYMEKMREYARKHGYVETLFGRRLYIPEINSRNIAQRNGAERAAINAPMQGTAADIIKIAMIHVAKWLETSGVNARLLMQVHDELVLEVEEKALEEVTKNISHLMSSAAKLDVPLLVESGTGHNWDEAH